MAALAQVPVVRQRSDPPTRRALQEAMRDEKWRDQVVDHARLPADHLGHVVQPYRAAVETVDFTGLLSFGHAAYLGAAAYTTGWLIRSAGWPNELGLLAGLGVAAGLGLVVELSAIRCQDSYFAMITPAMAQMIYFIFLQAPFTGGEGGLRGALLGGQFPLKSDIALYFVVLALFVAVFLAIIRIVHLPYGQVLKAIRRTSPA